MKHKAHNKKTQIVLNNAYIKNNSYVLVRVFFMQKHTKNITKITYMNVFIISSLFVSQGTQSLNPHNDYCQHFVDTGHRPQNFIRDGGKVK